MITNAIWLEEDILAIIRAHLEANGRVVRRIYMVKQINERSTAQQLASYPTTVTVNVIADIKEQP
jgi:hypothetical protein